MFLGVLKCLEWVGSECVGCWRGSILKCLWDCFESFVGLFVECLEVLGMS
jgi:hypothetical protein